MTKKSRYAILAVGFIFFLIAAPVIVLYVRGVSYDFKNKTFVKTGILGVRSVPDDAEIFLNGRLKRNSAGDVKFLLPGEYQVSLKKSGFSEWSKRLNVTAGQVAWASPAFSSIYLFFQDPPVQDLRAGVLDFYGRDKNFIFLTTDNITASSQKSENQKTYPLPESLNTILAADDNGKNFALTEFGASSTPPGLLLFNQNSGQFTNISGLFTSLPKIQFGQNGELYALSNNILYSVNPQNKTKAALFSGVKTFYLEDGDLYFVQKKSQNWALLVSQPPFSDSQVLLNTLPEFEQADLFVTFGKGIFLVGDGRLYLVNSAIQQLADNISGYNFSPGDSFLSIIHSGELDYYDPAGQSLNFITRSSEPITRALIKTSIGNAFFLRSNKLMAIELDARDNQNQYRLYQGDDVKKFYIDDAGKNILLLDGETLKSLNIR